KYWLRHLSHRSVLQLFALRRGYLRQLAILQSCSAPAFSASPLCHSCIASNQQIRYSAIMNPLTILTLTLVSLGAAVVATPMPPVQSSMTDGANKLQRNNAALYRNLLLRTRDALHTINVADKDLHKLANLLVQALSLKQGIRRQVTALRKRACGVLDLGGHCDAEYGAELLDQINHMLKPGGPGRR
ncbi:hypothetical protein BOX15_Mlig031819g2, partial [Macrostomum lignano]